MIKNFYEKIPSEYKQSGGGVKYKNYDRVRINVPFRLLVVGSSGSGKTNVVINLINIMSCFSKIYLFAKNTSEPLWAWFIDKMIQLSRRAKRELLVVSNDVSDMPNIDEVDENENNLFIFDDQITEAVSKQKAISELFIRGRKQNASAIYISQSYFDVPKLIRKNCDYIIIKKINTIRDLRSIIKEYNLSDITPEKLLEVYKSIVSKGMTRFLMIDLNTNVPQLKFRDCFNTINIQ